MSIIPQDPVLLQGTVRSNLDPEGKIPDAKLQEWWSIVQRDPALPSTAEDSKPPDQLETEKSPDYAPTAQITTNMTLDHPISQSGTNISLGQRQQISLVRALLADSKIVVLDEATSHLDPALDTLVQTRLSALLASKTVISIAHRLGSVLGFDRVLVLGPVRSIDAEKGSGSLREDGSPLELFDSCGEFWRACTEAGIDREDLVKARAVRTERLDTEIGVEKAG